MKFKKLIINLYKKRIISEKPHPLIPFSLGIITIIFLVIINYMNNNFFNQFKSMLIGLGIFIFIFAILHLIVWKIIKKNYRKL